jgi:hypothetical protein
MMVSETVGTGTRTTVWQWQADKVGQVAEMSATRTYGCPTRQSWLFIDLARAATCRPAELRLAERLVSSPLPQRSRRQRFLPANPCCEVVPASADEHAALLAALGPRLDWGENLGCARERGDRRSWACGSVRSQRVDPRRDRHGRGGTSGRERGAGPSSGRAHRRSHHTAAGPVRPGRRYAPEGQDPRHLRVPPRRPRLRLRLRFSVRRPAPHLSPANCSSPI